MDEKWLAEHLGENREDLPDSPAVAEMRSLLTERAEVFAVVRPDIVSSALVMPRRGLRHDESASFLRAVTAGIAQVDEAGYVTLPTVRQKIPVGRYALFSKSGTGVSVNLEYIIQIGATAELILDHGWPAREVGFEQGEFDAVTYNAAGRVVLAMEAKARVAGPDSLEKLVRSWMQFVADPTADLRNNAGRKWRELTNLCVTGPVVVWLVADGARWVLSARSGDAGPVLSPGGSPDRSRLTNSQTAPVLAAMAYDSTLHRPATLAAQGGCSWHGRTCLLLPMISFEDAQGRRQSGCQRAVEELTDRGELTWAAGE